MASLPINPDGDAHAECFVPDNPRAVSVEGGAGFIEITPGDRDDAGDPCEIEVREMDEFGEISVARIRPDAAGLASLIKSLLAELQRMNRV